MRKIAIAIGWSVLIGGAAATVSRVLMRAVSGFSDQAPAFSWGGTIGIVVFYILAVLPGAVVAAFTHRRWRWLVFAGPTILLAIVGAGIASTSVQDAPDTLGAVAWVGIWACTGFIFLIVFAQPVLVVRRIDRTLGRA